MIKHSRTSFSSQVRVFWIVLRASFILPRPFHRLGDRFMWLDAKKMFEAWRSRRKAPKKRLFLNTSQRLQVDWSGRALRAAPISLEPVEGKTMKAALNSSELHVDCHLYEPCMGIRCDVFALCTRTTPILPHLDAW